MVENIFQIRLHSRGGQGAKTAGQILAEAIIANGQFAQAFSEYGPERSGAPMKTFVRLSDHPIRLHGEVENPDLVVVMDPSLATTINVLEGLEPGGIILLNTPKTCEENCRLLGKGATQVRAVNATEIAIRLLGRDMPNTVLLGSMSKLLPGLPPEVVLEALMKRLGRKLSEEVVERNRQAFREGYEAF